MLPVSGVRGGHVKVTRLITPRDVRGQGAAKSAFLMDSLFSLLVKYVSDRGGVQYLLLSVVVGSSVCFLWFHT